MSLIVLIGVTGSGKTTVGRELSLRYELPLYEVDEAVEARLGAPMRTLVVGRNPRLGATARSSSNSVPIFPPYHAEKASVLRARLASAHHAPCSPS